MTAGSIHDIPLAGIEPRTSGTTRNALLRTSCWGPASRLAESH